MAYDPITGNVIVAMGVQGVVVGTADGRWTPTAVGIYAPADFSSRARVGTLLSRWPIGIACFCISLAILALWIARAWEPERTTRWDLLPAASFLVLVVLPAAVFVRDLDSLSPGVSVDPSADPSEAGLLKLLLLVLLLGYLMFAVLSAIAVAILVWHSRWSSLYWSLVAALVMVVAVTLPFVAWVLFGLSSGFAELVAIGLCVATTIALTVHLNRTESPSARRRRRAAMARDE